ncbi:MAG: hypothetical protein QXE42_01875 [Candidatus Aenigmatarchaeota archaeon]
MAINLLQTILGGFLASVVWFIVGGILYMNPFVAKIYKNFKNSPGCKKMERYQTISNQHVCFLGY